MTQALTWIERAAQDPTLRAFMDAEIARAGIERDTLRYNLEHAESVIAELERKLAAAQPKAERKPVRKP